MVYQVDLCSWLDSLVLIGVLAYIVHDAGFPLWCCGVSCGVLHNGELAC